MQIPFRYGIPITGVDVTTFQGVEWRDVDTCLFHATLRIMSLEIRTGNYSFIIMYDIHTRISYIMYIGGFVQMTRKAVIDKGLVTGYWNFRKVNKTFGLIYVNKDKNTIL